MDSGCVNMLFREHSYFAPSPRLIFPYNGYAQVQLISTATLCRDTAYPWDEGDVAEVASTKR
jgi:hypothetical protein